jgi:hypothetical protein
VKPAEIRAAQEAALLAALAARPGASVYELSLLVPGEDILAGQAPAPEPEGLFPELTLHTPATAASCARVVVLLAGLEKTRRARCDRTGLHRWYLAGDP